MPIQDLKDQISRLPEQQASWLFYWGGIAGCSAADADAFESFFRPRAASLRAASRALDQTLERIRLCEARRAIQAPEIRKYLERP